MNVNDVFGGIDPQLRKLAQALRTVVKKAIPEAVEQVKWGAPTYTIKGKNVANLMIYGDHVNLGFFMGAKLKSTRLEGTGKSLRHIKVWNRMDIDKKEFSRLLKEAAALVT